MHNKDEDVLGVRNVPGEPLGLAASETLHRSSRLASRNLTKWSELERTWKVSHMLETLLAWMEPLLMFATSP